MKIRKGFVTNSSSSSFIVALHKDTKSKDIRKMLDNNREIIEEKLEIYNRWNKTDLSYDDALEEMVDYFYNVYPEFEVDNWEFSLEAFVDDCEQNFSQTVFSYLNYDESKIRLHQIYD